MLSNNPTQMDSYNKHTGSGQGTPPLTQAPSWQIGLSNECIAKQKAMDVQSPEITSPKSTTICWIARVSKPDLGKMIPSIVSSVTPAMELETHKIISISAFIQLWKGAQ